jgi:hypothetical protein
MYETGFGFVIKGFIDLEKRAKETSKALEDDKKLKRKIEKVKQPGEHKPTFFETLSLMFKEEKDINLDN